MAKRSGIGKIFTIIGILLIAILLCYFSISIYLYFGDSKNVTSKLKVWNLMSDENIAELYFGVSYQIEGENVSQFGVNVHQNGYVLTLSVDLDSDETYTLYQKNGAIYGGMVVFLDEDLGLALIKLFDLQNPEKTLSLSYVEIGDISSSITSYNSSYISIGCPLEESNVLSVSAVYAGEYTNYLITTVDDLNVIKFVNANPYYFTVNDSTEYSFGGLFNKSGEILGLYYGTILGTYNDELYVVDVSIISEFLDSVVNSTDYQNALVDALVGFDMYQLQAYLYCSIETSSKYYIYFNGNWMTFSDNLLYTYQGGSDGVYLAEDFVYNGVTIPAGSFITSVVYGERSYVISTKSDLLKIFYTAQSGNTIKITAKNIDTQEVFRTNLTVI